MSEIIKLILSLSISGSILAGIIFVIKPLIKNKLSKKVQYYIWIIVLLRMILPFSFEGSVMNRVFYGNQAQSIAVSQKEVKSTNDTEKVISKIPVETKTVVIQPSDDETVNRYTNSYHVDNKRYINNIFSKYALYIWLIGTIIVLIINLYSYTRFKKHLKAANKEASYDEYKLLSSLLNGRGNVRLFKNQYVSTPMLIGIFKPCIMIPDICFSKRQLKNILLHEVIHLKRFDIGVKWLTMFVLSIHWFNPFMYFIKREINHACELSCDEMVIRNLNLSEKREYCDTLLSVAAEHRYPIGVLQATMCEEKKSLKERLVSIMSYSKKSKLIISISVVLTICIIFCAGVLGAGVGIKNKEMPYRVKIGAQIKKTRDLEEAVSAAIKADEKCHHGEECITEGHIILDIKENEGKVKVYTIASSGCFGFENGIFTKVSGSGAIPTVITFFKNENGEYELIEYATPFDGSEYVKSIKKMFPLRLCYKALNANKSYLELAKQEEAQAEEYLKSIGRKAKVSVEHVEKKLSDINVEASNKLFADLTRYDKFLNSCPYWLGTRE